MISLLINDAYRHKLSHKSEEDHMVNVEQAYNEGLGAEPQCGPGTGSKAAPLKLKAYSLSEVQMKHKFVPFSIFTCATLCQRGYMQWHFRLSVCLSVLFVCHTRALYQNS